MKIILIFKNAVITHIENLNAAHLNMTTEQFDKYCRGLSNGNQGLKLMQKNFKLLNELKDKKEMLRQDALKLQSEMIEFNGRMNKKVLECILKNDKKFLANLKSIEYFKQHLEEPLLIDLKSEFECSNYDQQSEQKHEQPEQTKHDNAVGDINQENCNKELISFISDDNNNSRITSE